MAALFCACAREPAPAPVAQASNANVAALYKALAEKDDEIAELRRHEKEHKGEHDNWLEFITENCLSRISVPEPVVLDTSFNPVYLRVNFDAGGAPGIAILVRGEESGLRGVAVCRDGKDAALFGQLARSMPPATGFDGDDFIIHSWGVISREKTRDAYTGDGKTRIGASVRGESVVFTHEGGNVFIYWDGKAFKVAEGF